MSGMMSLTRTFSWRTTFSRMWFWTLTMRMMFLEFVLPRMMYLLDNNNFQTALYLSGFACQRFLEHGWDDFCGERLFFWTAFCNATGSLGCFCFSWNLGYDTLEVKCTLHALIGSSMLHDRIKEKQGQHCIVADRAWTSYLCLFCVLREKVRARSSENLWVSTCGCLQVVFIGTAAEARTHVKERRARATRLVVVSLNFRTVAAAELWLTRRTRVRWSREEVIQELRCNHQD